VKVKKNKVAPPFRECEFDIMYDEGISREGDLLDLGAELGLIEKRGSYYLYKDDRLAQGRENTKQALREDPALCLEVENAIRRDAGLDELSPAPPRDLDPAAPQAAAVAEQLQAAGEERVLAA
jgi:recombination protein RecA